MEKEFKGTKGKWEYHIMGFNVSAYHCIKSKDGKTICLIYPKEHLSSEVECNAKLIATAPEMLKVLQRLVDLQEYKMENGKWEGYIEERMAIYDDVKKVINKALGL